jgi:MoaA/NifB/PqqE/SkfB family radical SAM enzyme
MINDKNKDTWCVNAFHGLRGSNDGSTSPCCMYESYTENPNLLGRETIDEHFNSELLQKLRSDLNNGIKNSKCAYCWNEENAGIKSKRIRDNDKFLKRNEPCEGLAYLELNLGNTCNLSCRTCVPEVSSGWMKESYDTGKKTKTYKEFALNFKKYHQSYDNESRFWDELIDKLPNIRELDFYGGEPFMSKRMWETLKIAQSTGASKHIILHYNTNGTHFPEKEIESWKSFKQVNISFSIDGIGDQFEYMRYPAKWDEVLINMNKIIELNDQFKNLTFTWCVTVSVANVYYLPEILEVYHNQFFNLGVGLYLNLVHRPDHYNIGILSSNIKKLIVDRLNTIPKDRTHVWEKLPGIINYMNNSSGDKSSITKFFNITRKSDDYRNQEFHKTFEEYAKLF